MNDASSSTSAVIIFLIILLKLGVFDIPRDPRIKLNLNLTRHRHRSNLLVEFLRLQEN